MKILLIGCGKMGGAMLSAWLARDLITHAAVVDPAVHELQLQFAPHRPLLDIYSSLEQLPKDFVTDLLVLAVKPQQMTELLATLSTIAQPSWPVMTIAAGLRVSYYARYLPQNPIIRVMPNTPAMLGQGMTVAVASPALNREIRARAEKLLNATGDFFWLTDELQMDAAMAVSASGPAYFFYWVEMLAKAGAAAGLSNEDAMRLARQTLIGSGAMAATRADISLEQMRREVTSPGGVTEATLRVWETGDAFQKFITAGIAANTKRAKELADC